MQLRLITLTLLFFLFVGCEKSNSERPIRIATNAWIGYTPLFMAKEQGLLHPLGFRLVHNVSLAEAMEIFSVGKAEMVTTTQHEYFTLQKDFHIKPVILLDRSDGGDMILANHPLSQILKEKKIDVYLELDSINNELFSDFAKKYGIPLKNCRFHDMDQEAMQSIQNDPERTILIVTYSPYHETFLRRGFTIIASTKDPNTIMVIDSLCALHSIIQHHRGKLRKLKAIIDRMVEELHEDPQKAYQLSKAYLNNISYEEFLHSLSLIKWINKPDAHLLQQLEQIGYDTSEILR